MGLEEAYKLSELEVTWALCSSSTPGTSGETEVAWQVGSKVRLKLGSSTLQAPILPLGPGITLHSPSGSRSNFKSKTRLSSQQHGWEGCSTETRWALGSSPGEASPSHTMGVRPPLLYTLILPSLEGR